MKVLSEQYCMLDQNLTLLFCVYISINFGKIPKSVCTFATGWQNQSTKLQFKTGSLLNYLLCRHSIGSSFEFLYLNDLWVNMDHSGIKVGSFWVQFNLRFMCFSYV